MNHLFIFLSFFLFWHESAPPFYATDLNNGLEQALIKSIESSQSSIAISVYSFSDKGIIRALRKKAEEGIKIEVTVDPTASRGIEKKLGPLIKIFPVKSKGLMHQKLIVIDDKKVWLGSANLTQDALRSQSNLMQEVTSAPLAAFVKEKIKSLYTPGRKKKFPHKVFSYNNQNLEFWFLPDDDKASIKIKDLIRSSQKSIKIAMYTFTRLDFAEALIKAEERGVNVEVILDQSQCDGACQRLVNKLKHSAVKLYGSDGSALMHNKLMIIDDQILVNGSANWTKAAFNQNEDYFFVLYDLSRAQKEALEKIWKALLYRASALLTIKAASDAPKKPATTKIHRLVHNPKCMIATPKATAGLKAAPEMAPTA